MHDFGPVNAGDTLVNVPGAGWFPGDRISPGFDPAWRARLTESFSRLRAALPPSSPRLHVSILIVDDEIRLVELLEKALRRMMNGFELRVETAGSPEDALALLERLSGDNRPLLVISDYNLGATRNGIELLNEVSSRFPSARRILMSGYDRSTFASALPESPLDAILSKPFQIGELTRLATALLRKGPP